METFHITHDQLQELETRLKTLDHVTKLGYMLIAGAFGLGGWVASIQLTQNAHNSAIKEQQEIIHNLELKDSSDTQLLKHIIEKLERIESKL